MFGRPVGDLSRMILATAVILKGLTWPAAPVTFAALYVLAGILALLGRWTRLAFGLVATTGWFILLADWYYGNHFHLLIAMTSLAAFVPWDQEEPTRSPAAALMMVQVSVLYFWAGIWKINAEFLSGSVLRFEWNQFWGPQLPGLSQVAIVVAITTIVLEIGSAVALWHRGSTAAAVLALLVLHLGMVLTIGSDWVVTAEVFMFGMVCASTYPMFLARSRDLIATKRSFDSELADAAD